MYTRSGGSGSGDKTIKRAVDMPPPTNHLNEAENDYPNRFPNEAQVPPVSTGGTLANVRSKDEAVDGRHILRSGSGFRSGAAAPDRRL